MKPGAAAERARAFLFFSRGAAAWGRSLAAGDDLIRPIVLSFPLISLA
jgi:hypothetical protein